MTPEYYYVDKPTNFVIFGLVADFYSLLPPM